MDPRRNIRGAEVVVRRRDLGAALSFLIHRLRFRIETIQPADDPSVAVVSGYGLRIRLLRDRVDDAALLRLTCDDPGALAGETGGAELEGPDGLRVELAGADVSAAIPPNRPSFLVSRVDDASAWTLGRADMHYRDLIPGRQGGRFIASHIRIPAGGEVPDYVHFHRVRFQMIYCYRGWVRVVYEDQGPPFVLQAGDCVLQPPTIRHRVLECSSGLEVLEIGCPAAHATHADHDLALPTAWHRPDREFDGQRFVRHEARRATWGPWRVEGYECRDTGIEKATGGLAGARVVRAASTPPVNPSVPAAGPDAEFLFTFVLEGSASLETDGQGPLALGPGDCFTMPPGQSYGWAARSDDLEFLEVSLPAHPTPA